MCGRWQRATSDDLSSAFNTHALFYSNCAPFSAIYVWHMSSTTAMRAETANCARSAGHSDRLLSHANKLPAVKNVIERINVYWLALGMINCSRCTRAWCACACMYTRERSDGCECAAARGKPMRHTHISNRWTYQRNGFITVGFLSLATSIWFGCFRRTLRLFPLPADGIAEQVSARRRAISGSRSCGRGETHTTKKKKTIGRAETNFVS